jgi:hypothetical protein
VGTKVAECRLIDQPTFSTESVGRLTDKHRPLEQNQGLRRIEQLPQHRLRQARMQSGR